VCVGCGEARLARGGRRTARKRLQGKDASYVRLKACFGLVRLRRMRGTEGAYVDDRRARVEERKVRNVKDWIAQAVNPSPPLLSRRACYDRTEAKQATTK
jgi:hypothetical protein